VTQWLPCKRRIFINRLRKLGFVGLFSGTNHQFMSYNNYRLTIPSNKEYSVPQLRVMIREIENITGRNIPSEEWEKL
jgi:hypothetical protein